MTTKEGLDAQLAFEESRNRMIMKQSIKKMINREQRELAIKSLWEFLEINYINYDKEEHK